VGREAVPDFGGHVVVGGTGGVVEPGEGVEGSPAPGLPVVLHRVDAVELRDVVAGQRTRPRLALDVEAAAVSSAAGAYVDLVAGGMHVAADDLVSPALEHACHELREQVAAFVAFPGQYVDHGRTSADGRAARARRRNATNMGARCQCGRGRVPGPPGVVPAPQAREAAEPGYGGRRGAAAHGRAYAVSPACARSGPAPGECYPPEAAGGL
jgi:hypothetical protein